MWASTFTAVYKRRQNWPEWLKKKKNLYWMLDNWEKTISGRITLGKLVPSLIASHSNECQSNNLEPNCCKMALLCRSYFSFMLEKFAAGIFVETNKKKKNNKLSRQTSQASDATKRLQTFNFSKLSRWFYCADVFRLILCFSSDSVFCSSEKGLEFYFIFLKAINLWFFLCNLNA